MNLTRELLIVRHCQSSGQAPDAPLTEAGLAQARGLARVLARFPIDYVASSPYRRARESITPFAQHRGLAIVEHPDLRERLLSPDPLPDWLEQVARSFSDPDHAVASGESGRVVAERAWKVLDAILGAGHRLPLVVSHGNWIAFALKRVRPEIDFDFWRSMTSPDLFRLGAGAETGWSLERIALDGAGPAT
jgi:2,3-bisphosphoglycerate-dependent phosphoglycerate mutase